MEVSIRYLNDDKVIGKEEPGTSVLVVTTEPKDSVWKYHLKCYKCGFVCGLADHIVQIIDEKVTLTPSVLCPIEKCQAHYFIKDGKVVDT